MKKLILFFAAFLLLTASLIAQTLSLSTTAGPQPNGSDYTVFGDYQTTITAYVAVHNNSANNISVLVKKTEVSVLGNSTNYFCWVQCYGGNVFVSPDAMPMAPNSVNLSSFSGDYDSQGHLGTSTIRYTFYLDNNANDSVAINVHFYAGYAGINDPIAAKIQFSDAYPNPARNNVSFTYSLPSVTSGNASVTVRNLLGSEVKNIAITDKQGKLNFSVADLESGVYFYSLIVDNASVLTRKLIIK
ncbi:MAG: T9SS type A sorting domain-containing protein [Bacteroidota bacterium]